MSHKDARRALAGADDAFAQADAVLEQADRRQAERRKSGRPPAGRRSVDVPANAWSTGQMAYWIGMTTETILCEINTGELHAAMFGREYRIHIEEVRRYLTAKGFPLPTWMMAA